MGAPLVGVVLSVIRVVISNPLVDRIITNWTEGTHNKIDDWVWTAIKAVAMMDAKNATERENEIKERLGQLQAKYNDMDAEALYIAKNTSVVDASFDVV